jgi:uncharacterized membrane protein
MSSAARPVTRPRSNSKLIFFVCFGLATVFVLYMKNARVFDPTSEIAQHFAPVKLLLIVHAFFAALALTMGVFQFSNRLRARYPAVHRRMGYLYVAGVFIGGPMGVPIAYRIGSLSVTFAASVQAFGWMVTTAIALYCIKRGNIAQHRRWMIRSYPFGAVFTFARLLIPIPPILKLGLTGVEIVVWSTVALAAFLPSVALEWSAIQARPAVKTSAVMAKTSAA